MVHPSIVVGLVSGTGASLVFRSATVGCGAFSACFASNGSVIWRLRFDFAGWGSASTLTEGDVGLGVKKFEFTPTIHPRQKASAKDNTPAIIVMACRVTSRAGATTAWSRLSILISRFQCKCSFRCSSLNLIDRRRQVRSRLAMGRRGRPVSAIGRRLRACG